MAVYFLHPVYEYEYHHFISTEYSFDPSELSRVETKRSEPNRIGDTPEC